MTRCSESQHALPSRVRSHSHAVARFRLSTTRRKSDVRRGDRRLIAAIAFVALVALTAVPLLKLGRVLEEVRLAVRDIGHESVPILTELQAQYARPTMNWSSSAW